MERGKIPFAGKRPELATEGCIGEQEPRECGHALDEFLHCLPVAVHIGHVEGASAHGQIGPVFRAARAGDACSAGEVNCPSDENVVRGVAAIVPGGFAGATDQERTRRKRPHEG